ncbi:MAG TPA: hypothetical protein VF142_00130 [Longimicrobium sp.]
MAATDEYTHTLQRRGFAVVEDVVPEGVVCALLPALANVEHEGAVERRGSIHAVRNLLVMRPALLHASSPATRPGHRRVVHLEFAADELPHGLQWHGRW